MTASLFQQAVTRYNQAEEPPLAQTQTQQQRGALILTSMMSERSWM